MKELRPLIHELFNALSIAHGMTDIVKEALAGNLELPPEDKIKKIEKALKAIERAEEIANQLKTAVRQGED
jgi:hypothetical protein